MLAIFQISFICFFSCCWQKECFQELGNMKEKRKKGAVKSTSAWCHRLSRPSGLMVLHLFFFHFFWIKQSEVKFQRCVESSASCFSVSSWLLYRFEILDKMRNWEPEFPGGSVSLKSQLVWMEERRRISSCVFIHSNQESVEQERRLGSEGTLPH